MYVPVHTCSNQPSEDNTNLSLKKPKFSNKPNYSLTLKCYLTTTVIGVRNHYFR